MIIVLQCYGGPLDGCAMGGNDTIEEGMTVPYIHRVERDSGAMEIRCGTYRVMTRNGRLALAWLGWTET